MSSWRCSCRGACAPWSAAGEEERMRRVRVSPPGVDPRLLIKDAAKLLPSPSRRLFLRNGASLGALTLLTGCDIIEGISAEGALRKMSEFNDRVQALLFNPRRLAQTYPES